MLRMLQVSMVLSALQAGNKGTQACITAASAVSGIIADLDTTIMFASAGTLDPENEESFADHRCDELHAHTTGRRGHVEFEIYQIWLKMLSALVFLTLSHSGDEAGYISYNELLLSDTHSVKKRLVLLALDCHL